MTGTTSPATTYCDSASFRLFGRDNELCLIQDALERVAEEGSPSAEVVLVRGSSGCGKSAIVKALRQWTIKERSDVKILFGTGKYDQLVNNEPFAAIMAASNELCNSIEPLIARQFVENFRAMTGGDTTMLMNAIPGLADLISMVDRNEIGDSSICSSSNDKDDLQQQQQQRTPSNAQFATISKAFTRFKQLWQSLLLAASSCSDAVVLFLDDVQWADQNSIELIHTITKVTRARNILLICAFRDDATVEKAQLERIRWCFSLKGSQNNSSDDSVRTDKRRWNTTDMTKLTVPLTEVKLGALQEAGMKDLVCGLLYGRTIHDSNYPTENAIGAKGLAELSNVVQAHTRGNPHFALHYLDYLTRIGLLWTFDGGASWEWDLQRIKHQQTIPQSTAELLQSVIDDLPSSTRNVLVVAAHVGFQFSANLFQSSTFMSYLAGLDQPRDSRNGSSRAPRETTKGVPSTINVVRHMDIDAILTSAFQEGLLEVRSSGMYSFPHDQIQQALYKRLSDQPHEQAEIHLTIGKALFAMIDQNRSNDGFTIGSAVPATARAGDTILFSAVNNMNKGAREIKSPHDKTELAKLNYHASRAALAKAAIGSAIEYIRAAMSLLGPNRWTAHYALCLDVCSLAADLEYSAGNQSRCRELLLEIQSNGKHVIDKLPSYLTEIRALSSNRQTHEAIKLASKVLGLLGEPVPTKPGVLQVVLEYRRARSVVNKAKALGLASLPRMTSATKLAALNVMGLGFVQAYEAGSKFKNWAAILALRMATVTCLHGLCFYSPVALSPFSAVQCNLGDFEGSRDTARVALDLLDRIEGTEGVVAKVEGGIAGAITPWLENKSLADIQPDLLRCHHRAMAHGDVQFAFICVGHHLCCGVIRGTPIPEMNNEFVRYIGEMDEYQMNQYKVFSLGFFRMVRILTGRGDVTCSGDTLNVTFLYKEMKLLPQTEFVACVGSAFQIVPKILLGTFGLQQNLKEDCRLLDALIKHPKAASMHLSRSICDLALALGCIELYKQTGKRMYKRNGRKVFQWLEMLYKKKSSLGMGTYRLICAEQMVANPRKRSSSWENIEAAYVDAVDLSRRIGGFAAVEGFALERLAEQARRHGNMDSSASYRRDALALYGRWGATEKVRQLSAAMR